MKIRTILMAAAAMLFVSCASKSTAPAVALKDNPKYHGGPTPVNAGTEAGVPAQLPKPSRPLNSKSTANLDIPAPGVTATCGGDWECRAVGKERKYFHGDKQVSYDQVNAAVRQILNDSLWTEYEKLAAQGG